MTTATTTPTKPFTDWLADQTHRTDPVGQLAREHADAGRPPLESTTSTQAMFAAAGAPRAAYVAQQSSVR